MRRSEPCQGNDTTPRRSFTSSEKRTYFSVRAEEFQGLNVHLRPLLSPVRCSGNLLGFERSNYTRATRRTIMSYLIRKSVDSDSLPAYVRIPPWVHTVPEDWILKCKRRQLAAHPTIEHRTSKKRRRAAEPEPLSRKGPDVVK